ncbi:hypothetical protein QAD02_006090 [Eretmocerus hayati]|uniref:Uncharacterized protein n=1 Tax=Eretmocerus hayati TaxID=131215 RepID=A0ACC2N109_9HYME|nr:hypothetical protein QAD02_006090 [Eretmocerus hayati]
MDNLSLLLVLCIMISIHQGTTLEHEAIIGGELARPGQFPYQVLLDSWYGFDCGGSIIGERHVVTAAHCLHDGSKFREDSYRIVVGISHVASRSSRSKVMEVQQVYVPKQFTGEPELVADIAILKLKKALKSTTSRPSRKLELPENKSYAGVKATISGFGWNKIRLHRPSPDGRFVEEGSSSGHLRFAEADVMSLDECQKNYADPVYESQLCARIVQRDQNSPEGFCTGDSGSPLVYNGTTLIGIASFNEEGCVENITAGVYTNVSNYLGFIQQVIEDSPDLNVHTLIFS